MKSVGTFEAKTKLSALLEEVEGGATITITKHGRPVAMLVPANGMIAVSGDDLVQRFQNFRRRQPTIAREERRAWVDEGRE